jgi:hypothetical protein
MSAPEKRAEAFAPTLNQSRLAGRINIIGRLSQMIPQPTTAPAAPAIDRSIYLEPSTYDIDGGEMIGRHPRSVSIDLLRLLPAPTAPMKAIRAKCLDCCVYQPGEVRKCVAVKCPLWPYRMGFSPYHAKSVAAKNAEGLEAGFEESAALLAHEGESL